MTRPDPEDLRQTVLRAAVPLLGEYHTLTTARIAEAAGVSEPDLLTVFADTEAVMRACVAMLTEATAAALDPAETLRELDAVGTDQPLAARLARVVDILEAYRRHTVATVDAMVRGGTFGTVDVPDSRTDSFRDNADGLTRTDEFRQAVAKLLEPEQAVLRLSADALAAAFAGMTCDGIRPTVPGRPRVSTGQVVDLFLHGALTTGEGRSP